MMTSRASSFAPVKKSCTLVAHFTLLQLTHVKITEAEKENKFQGMGTSEPWRRRVLSVAERQRHVSS